MHPKHLKRCRVCGNSRLAPAVDLGEQHLQGSFLKKGFPSPPMRKLSLRLVRCDAEEAEDACGLLQMAHTFPPEILYSNYWYRSGINKTMRAHLRNIALDAASMSAKPENGARRVLDIGCNDGTLLQAYPESYVKYGVDPSDIARGIGPGITVVNTVFPSPEAMSTIEAGSIDITTSIAMFYDLDDPVGFAKCVKSLLAPAGIWIMEMSYLPLMLRQNAFDTICHEHIEYYSLDVIEHILRLAGLKAFKASLNDINGGSISVHITHQDNSCYDNAENGDRLRAFRVREFELRLDTPAPYLEFQKRIENLRRKTVSLLGRIRAEGGVIHAYGASTKGNVLLQWYGLNRPWLEAAADRNPDKHGAETLGTGIPIISETQSRARKPDYYLVLPWHFIREFLQREREIIMSGVQMIFPLPELIVVNRDNLDQVMADLDKAPPAEELFAARSEPEV